MDVGLSHIVTVNGEKIKVDWITFNPNHSLGKHQQILIFDQELNLVDVYRKIDEAIATTDFVGEFYLAGVDHSLNKFKALYEVEIGGDDNGLSVKTFVFMADGKPWAMCNISQAINVPAHRDVVFCFESTVVVNSGHNISANTHTLNATKFSLEYAHTVGLVKDNGEHALVSSLTGLADNLTDVQIEQALANGSAISPLIDNQGSAIKLTLKANEVDKYVDVKAVFVRILWNLGIVVYIKSFKTKELDHKGLTLSTGQSLSFSFSLGFKGV